MKQNWPQQIWIVRHGESAGIVARDAADLAGHSRIDIAERDVDVPLSAIGQQQAEALSAWFGNLPVTDQPDIILSSPYKRSMRTADTIAERLSTRHELTVARTSACAKRDLVSLIG